MPVFEYKGLDQSGKLLKGTEEAESLRAAKEALKKQGLFLQEIKIRALGAAKKGRVFSPKKAKTKDLAVFTRLLSTLLKSNIPLVEALEAISEQTPDPYFAGCIIHIKEQVNQGKPFYLSLKEHPSIFDSIFVSLCESGETGGNLDEILEKLADLMEKRSEIANKVTSALIYPGILFFITICIMVVICNYVIPSVVELFENKDDLPWMTRFTIGLSGFLINYWLSLLAGLAASGFLFLKWKKTRSGKPVWDRFLLSLPVAGRLIRAADISMFSRTLAALLHGGVPVLRSLDIVKNVARNEMIRKAIASARENIKEGESIVAPLRRSGQFPPVALQMIRIGEKTGELENMLDHISQAYDRQVELEVGAFTALLGPVMLIVMAGLIGFIIISIMLPMLGSFGDLG